MSVPKQRHSQGRTNRKRAQYKQVPKTLVECKNCGKSKTAHRICSNCGTYKGRGAVDTMKKKSAGKK